MTIRLLAILLLLTMGANSADAAVTMYWRAEGTTLDEAGNNDYSVGDAVAGAIGTPALNATAMKYGTNGMHINASNEYYQFDLAEDFVSLNAGAVAFWIQWVAFTTDASSITSLRGNTSTNYIYVRGVSTDELRLVTNTGALQSTYDTTDANITTGNWYFFCTSWNDSANTRKIYLWDASGVAVGSSPWQDTSTNFNSPSELTGASARLRFGEASNVGGTPEYYMDNIFVGDGDDCTTFYNNRTITAYSSYSAGGGSSGVPNGLMLLGVGK